MPEEINRESAALMLRKYSVCCAVLLESYLTAPGILGGCLKHLGPAAVREVRTEMPAEGGALLATIHGLESLMVVADMGIVSCEREGTNRYQSPVNAFYKYRLSIWVNP